MKKTFFLSILTFALFSCKGDAESVIQSGNSDFKIEFLFEHDGCKIYRFYDGKYIYWTDCKGKMEQNFNESSGKTTHNVHIQNETVR